jgi:hypothetical protein
MKYGLVAAMILLPSLALAATPQTLQLSAKAQIDGADVPLGVVVSTENTDVTLSPANKDGSTPVTFTLYVTPKPKPAPVVATTSAAAAIESSAGIQQNINNISPVVESYVKPAFTLIDGARNAAANTLDTQLAGLKKTLGTNAGSPGEVLGAEATKNATSNPGGAFWYILQTLYFYLLTVLRFVIGSVAFFYPFVAIVFLYFIWRMFRRFRRPAY